MPVKTVQGPQSFHRIHLSAEGETKVKGRFAFGSDPSRCDVLLSSKRGQQGISGLHFYITFDNKRNLVVKDVSTNGLAISYDRQAAYERRSHFQWIIFPHFDIITIRLPRNGLTFNAHFPRHYRGDPSQYNKQSEAFMAGTTEEHEVAFDNLALRSHGTSVVLSELLSPSKRPIYLFGRELGKGSFGRVWKVTNASTGDEYAGKEFFHESGWEREIAIMKKMQHEHIVKFIDFRQRPRALLVMEYQQLGNLSEQNIQSPIAIEEWVVLLHQCLTALEYLHSHKVTHRDLKPENILVCSRTPFKVAVADFGLAKDDADLKTFCGNARYSAPEIFLGRPYTSAVDIWPLGVIVMEGLYGLPDDKRRNSVKQRDEVQKQALSWCQLVLDVAKDWDSDLVIDFLTGGMITWEPGDRLPASACLKAGLELGIFKGVFAQTGNLTPRIQPNRRSDILDLEDTAAISRLDFSTPQSQGRRFRARAEREDISRSITDSTTSLSQGAGKVNTAKRRRTTSQPSSDNILVARSEEQLLAIEFASKAEHDHPNVQNTNSTDEGIPSLPSLAANSIDELTVAKDNRSPASNNQHRCGPGDSNVDHIETMSKRSHLSQVPPKHRSSKIDEQSFDYSQFLDEDDNAPLEILKGASMKPVGSPR